VFLFNKTNRRTNFSNLFLLRKSTFSGSSSAHHQEFPPVHSTLVYNIKTAWHIPVPNVQWETPDDGQRNCPRHVEFLDKNKFGKFVHLLVLLKRNLLRCTVTCYDARSHVTMHGHMLRCTVTCYDARSHEHKIHVLWIAPFFHKIRRYINMTFFSQWMIISPPNNIDLSSWIALYLIVWNSALEVLTWVLLKIPVFWDVTLCHWLGVFMMFQMIIVPKMKTLRSLKDPQQQTQRLSYHDTWFFTWEII
jgi:hypothetical protein